MTAASHDDLGSELADVADELYGLDPADFVPARNDLVRRLRKDGQRNLATQVAALRRPSPAAWAVNQLARRHRPELEGLLRLGDALRTAQTHTLAGADAGDLRNAGRARRDAVAELAESAVGLLGQRASGVGGHYAEVVATLEAASLDPQAAARVSSGRLTSALDPPSGFGDFEIDAASPLTGHPRPTPPPQTREPLEDEPSATAADLTETLAEARRDVADASRVTKSVAAAARDAAASAAQREREVEESEADLDGLRRAVEKAEQRVEANHHRAALARQAADEARRAAARAEAAEAEVVARLDEAVQRAGDRRAARRREP
ncbi:MAG: hypothetical protein ACR2LJ_10655 [Acidimicrobiales bacterium]